MGKINRAQTVTPVSTHLTYKNLRSLRKPENILGILTDDFSDEHFEFYHANQIMLSSSKAGKTFEQGLNIRGGAMAGYYFRRALPEYCFCGDLEFPRKGYDIALRVYSNDTCDGSCYGLDYGGAIVFPRSQLSRGVGELFDLIRKQSETGIIKELTPEELAKVQKLIVEDLRTQKHTKKARIRGMELDAMHGM